MTWIAADLPPARFSLFAGAVGATGDRRSPAHPGKESSRSGFSPIRSNGDQAPAETDSQPQSPPDQSTGKTAGQTFCAQSPPDQSTGKTAGQTFCAHLHKWSVNLARAALSLIHAAVHDRHRWTDLLSGIFSLVRLAALRVLESVVGVLVLLLEIQTILHAERGQMDRPCLNPSGEHDAVSACRLPCSAALVTEGTRLLDCQLPSCAAVDCPIHSLQGRPLLHFRVSPREFPICNRAVMLFRLPPQGLKRIPGLAPARFRQKIGASSLFFPACPLPQA
ncbi:MAG: hypothetical protein RLZZ179_3360 [Verrucomicrobiota bacterium]